MLRSLVEKCTKSLSFKRRLPHDLGGGKIYVSPSAGLRYLFSPMNKIDPYLYSLAKEFITKGDIIWDIGANVGLFSYVASHLSGAQGRVISFEPDAWLIQMLRHSSSIQPASSAPVKIVPVAVAESVDLRTFNIAVRSRSTNFISGYGSTQTGGVAEKQTIISVSIDWLLKRLPPPDILKIDVEGAELEAFKGATKLFERKKPIIICEVNSECSPEITSILKKKGYKIYDGEAETGKRQELNCAPFNTLAIPNG